MLIEPTRQEPDAKPAVFRILSFKSGSPDFETSRRPTRPTELRSDPKSSRCAAGHGSP